MISVYDVDGYKGEIGSRRTIAEIEDVMSMLNFQTAIDFFKEGFTIKNKELLDEFESIDIGAFGGIEDTIQEMMPILKRSRDIIILSEGIE